MDQHRETRTEATFPVRIWGVDSYSRPFMQLASVCNLSSLGAVLQNVRAQIRRGEILDVQYDGQHAQFRVIWAGRPGTLEAGALGIERLPQEPHIWNVDLARCGRFVSE
jgi:hypothetical protein